MIFVVVGNWVPLFPKYLNSSQFLRLDHNGVKMEGIMAKAKYKISNWKQYNQALINQGSVTFWIDVAAIKAGHCLKYHGHRNRRFLSSDTLIEMVLMVKNIFKLPLRGLKGFINSVFTLKKVPPRSPTYTCISKCSKTVKVRYRLPSRGAVSYVVIDATSLKVYGER